MIQGQQINVTMAQRPSDRADHSLTTQYLRAAFGLRAVRCVGGLAAEEHAAALGAAHSALETLARALCVPTAELGLGGGLTLFLGARARDTGAATAARGLWSLNVPVYGQPIGSLAHSWANFLDNRLAGAPGFASSAALQHLKTKGAAPAVPDCWTPMVSMMADLVLGNREATETVVFSPFAAQALEADRRRRPPHFSTGSELFARAFEVWLETTMRAQGRSNPFLVSANGRGLDEYASGVYPQADERQRVAAVVGSRLPALLEAAGMAPDVGQFVAGIENLAAASIETKDLIAARNWLAAGKTIHRARLLAANGGIIYGIEAHTKDGSRWGAILPEMSGGGGDARIQFFDADGLLGHVVYRDEETALRELIAQRYVVPDLGAMDRLQAMPHWHRAIPAAIDAQRRHVFGT